jgi:signal transduction histidine kinase
MIGLSPTARLAEEDRAALDDVVSQAAYMERLVADLSLLARLDESRLPLNMEQIEIAELLQTAGRSARTLAAQKNITVEVRAQGGAAIKGDGMRLQELLLALIDNAVRYTPPGGRITIEAQDGGAPAIRVSDTGPGIPQEQMSRIFERFSRGDEARSRDGGGTGLGLSVAQAIAHAHGGKITAQNSASGGAVFTLVLPAV